MINRIGIKIVICYLFMLSVILGGKLLILGAFLLIIDLKSIIQESGGNLTGLGLILGVTLIILGSYFLNGFKLALEISRNNKNVIRRIFNFLGVASIFIILAPGMIAFPLRTRHTLLTAIILIVLNVVSMFILGTYREVFSDDSKKDM